MTDCIQQNPVTSCRKKTSVHSLLVIAAAVLLLGLVTAVYLNAGYLANWIRGAAGLEFSTITILQTLMLLVNLVTIPLCSWLTLKFSDFKLFVTGYVFCIAGILGMFFFPNIAGLVIFYVLFFGFGSAVCGYAVALSVVLPLISEKHAGIAAAALISCGNISSLILFPALQGVETQLPAGQIFLILGVIGLCLLPLIYYIFRRRKHASAAVAMQQKNKAAPVSFRSVAKEIFTSRRFYLLCLLSFTFGLFATAPSGNMLHTSEVYYGLDAAGASIYLSLFSLIFVVSGIVAGIFIPKVKSKMLYTGILFALVALLHIGYFFDEPLALGMINLFIIAAFIGCISPSISLLTRDWTGPVKFATVYCLVYMMLRLGGIATIFLGGIWYAEYQDFMFPFAAEEIVIATAAVFALIVGIREIYRKKAEANDRKA
ncbi:MAG: MFS transporter [Methanocorpusculum sp.]|nr:MFS transporter [Methanocorpusculum sp.]